MTCKYYGTRNKADFNIKISQKQYSENLIIYVCIHTKILINILIEHLFIYFTSQESVIGCDWADHIV